MYIDSDLGGYYSFYTATAGTGGTGFTSGNAPSSVCPKGWRLPTSNEFSTLFNYYNTSSLLNGVPGFAFTGYARNGDIAQKYGDGWYWSSNVRDSDYSYVMHFATDGGKSPNEVASKKNGRAIHCIAK